MNDLTIEFISKTGVCSYFCKHCQIKEKCNEYLKDNDSYPLDMRAKKKEFAKEYLKQKI